MNNNYYKYQIIFLQKLNSLDYLKSYYSYQLLYKELINEINNNLVFNKLQLLDLFILKFNNLKNISQNIYIFFKLLHIILDINNNIQISLKNPIDSYQELYEILNEINEIYQKLSAISNKYENYNFNINIIYEKIKLKDLNEFINIPSTIKSTVEFTIKEDNKQNIINILNIINKIVKELLDIKQLKIDLKNYYNYTNQIFEKYLLYLNTVKDTIPITDNIKSNIINDINNINKKHDIWKNKINKYYNIIYNSIIKKESENNQSTNLNQSVIQLEEPIKQNNQKQEIKKDFSLRTKHNPIKIYKH